MRSNIIIMFGTVLPCGGGMEVHSLAPAPSELMQIHSPGVGWAQHCVSRPFCDHQYGAALEAHMCAACTEPLILAVPKRRFHQAHASRPTVHCCWPHPSSCRAVDQIV